jgi:high affinity Mn2+ porin
MPRACRTATLFVISCVFLLGGSSFGQSESTNAAQTWNFHAQNTDIVNFHPGYHAAYTGPNSLTPNNEVRETVSADVLFGYRLWRGAEAHVDALTWQGFGFSDTHGIEGFPNGEGSRVGTKTPNETISRLFIRQTINLGGEQETVADGALQLAGQRDVSRLTFTVGKMSAKDIFDLNAYSADPRTQFMNWTIMANAAWDFPGDALGYISGATVELNEPHWTARYGFFQMPRVSNGIATDPAYVRAWGMVTELEHRHTWRNHSGAVRVLAFLNRAHMGSFQQALDNPVRPADIEATRAYRYKYGFGLNLEQELATDIGVFSRLGWNDGKTESWTFDDVDHTISAGLSIKGTRWQRTNDTIAIAGAINGATRVHRDFFAAGGTGILAGDGRLNYGLEKLIETYYSANIWKTLYGTIDYQFVTNPAFNRDRGPVHVFSARIHWEY